MAKILLIEDEEAVRENILELLESENFQTIAAVNGKIGVELAITEVPDLILCDLMMPEMDGYGVLEALREQAKTSVIPFIFLTARSARADFRKGMSLGADDYLTKPFTRAELLSAISSRLSKQAHLAKNLSALSTYSKNYPEMQVIEVILRRTLESGNFHEFQLDYQPQLNIKTGKIVAVESLLSWHSPLLGKVSPTELIPLAESTGLITPIGEWVLQRACQQIKAWKNSGFDNLNISVNLSARQLIQEDFIAKIAKILEKNNLPGKKIEIEINESMIVKDMNHIIAMMRELKSIGVKIILDEFGTGYNSLMNLKKYPVDALKLDPYFIRNIDSDMQKAVITKALIQMAHNLHLQVVAKGVETTPELSFLRENKCDIMQGFLFSRPLKEFEFEKLVFADNTLHK